MSRELLLAKVYAALESKQPRTLEEMVECLGVSRMTAFRVLKELVSKQLVRREEEIMVGEDLECYSMLRRT